MIPKIITPNAMCVTLDPMIGIFFLFNSEKFRLKFDRFLGNKSIIETITIHMARASRSI